MSNWLKSGLAAVLGAFLGALATVVTGVFGYLNKDREIDMDMVKTALVILSGEQIDASSRPARAFALRALEKYSEVDIPDDEFLEWVETGTVPQGTFTIETVPGMNPTSADAERIVRGVLAGFLAEGIIPQGNHTLIGDLGLEEGQIVFLAEQLNSTAYLESIYLEPTVHLIVLDGSETFDEVVRRVRVRLGTEVASAASW